VDSAGCGDLPLTWQTESPGGDGASGPIRVRIPVAFIPTVKFSEEPTWSVALNGRHVIDLTASAGDAVWTNPDTQTTARFVAFTTADESASGLLEFELPPGFVSPGRNLEWELRPRANVSDAWLGILIVPEEAASAGK
jgi:hypothetical protein